MRAAGIRPQDVGNHDVFIPLRGVIAGRRIGRRRPRRTPDFGRRLAQRQGIEILGPVGVAARTAATVADAFAIFENFMAAYSPAISAVRITPLADPERSFFEFRIFDRTDCRRIRRSMELSLGVTLRVLRLLLGADYAPLSVHLPHEPLTPARRLRRSISAVHRTSPSAAAGFHHPHRRSCADHSTTIELAHQAVVRLPQQHHPHDTGIAESVRTIVRQLLPTGAATLED